MLAAALVAAASPAFSDALPGLAGARDSRVRVDMRDMPWAAVARLQIPGESRCTAVLIAPQVAVTAAHCVYGRRLGRFVPPGAINALFGYDGGRYARHAVVATYAVMPGFNPQGQYGGGADLALLRFAQPVGERVVPLAPDAQPGAPVMLGGYGQDRQEVVLADTLCTARGLSQGQDGRPMLVHDCQGTRGTSGGPVFTRLVDGSWALVGVQVASNTYGVGGAAVPVATVRALLAAQ